MRVAHDCHAYEYVYEQEYPMDFADVSDKRLVKRGQGSLRSRHFKVHYLLSNRCSAARFHERGVEKKQNSAEEWKGSHHEYSAESECW